MDKAAGPPEERSTSEMLFFVRQEKSLEVL
jgi:hypothetical protein